MVTTVPVNSLTSERRTQYSVRGPTLSWVQKQMPNHHCYHYPINVWQETHPDKQGIRRKEFLKRKKTLPIFLWASSTTEHHSQGRILPKFREHKSELNLEFLMSNHKLSRVMTMVLTHFQVWQESNIPVILVPLNSFDPPSKESPGLQPFLPDLTYHKLH